MKSLLKTSLLALALGISITSCHTQKDIAVSSQNKKTEIALSSATNSTITEECDSLVKPDSISLTAQGSLSTLVEGGVIGVSTNTGTVIVKYDSATGQITAEAKVKPPAIPVKKKKTTVINQQQAITSNSEESTYSKDKKVDRGGIAWYWIVLMGFAFVLIIVILARALYKKLIP